MPQGSPDARIPASAGRLRLLFVIKSLTLPGGGAERVLAELTSELANRGHEVKVATFDAAGSRTFYRFDDRVEFIPLAIGRVDRGSTPVEVALRIRALRRLARETRPDVVVGFMHSAYVPVALATAGLGVPAVGSEHIVYEHYSDRVIDRIMLQLAGRLLAAGTAISASMRDGFPEPLRRKLHVIPNPVRLIGSPQKQARATGSRTLLTVGRLEKQKDQAALVSAFAKLADDFPEWRLRIVGEGALRQDLENQIARLDLSERVELPGAVAEIEREYGAAELFAMPSLYESFGIATAEALAAGVPAVGFAECPGTNEIIKDDVNGLLASGEDRAEALAEALRQLMSDDERRQRLGRAGPHSVAEYALPAVADRWEELLSSVVVMGRPRMFHSSASRG